MAALVASGVVLAIFQIARRAALWDSSYGQYPGTVVTPALYEAARVDGASAWQRTRYVTLPQLKGVNSVVLSVIVIDSLRSFDIIWSMTRGGPYHSSELLSTYMYSTAFQSTQLGYASAIAVVIFLLALAVILGYLIRAFREET